jgi:hypothetical protein
MQSLILLSREIWDRLLLLYEEVILQIAVMPSVWESFHTPFLFSAEVEWDLA